MPAKDRPGRYSKLTEDIIDKIAAILLEGNTRGAAANAAGVAYETFRVWLRRGEDELAKELAGEPFDKLYADFAWAVQESEAQAERYFVNLVYKGASNDPKFALEWLLRRRKKDWSSRTELTGEDGGPVAHTVGNMTPDQIATEAAAIEARILARVTGNALTDDK